MRDRFVQSRRPARRLAAIGLLTVLGAASASAQTASSVVNPDRARVQAWQQAQPHRNMSGNVAVPEVVSGSQVKPGRWPFMVALVSKGTVDNYDAQFCGGSLIDERNVLTASHCVFGASASGMQVLVGTQSLATGGRRIDVTRVTTHPDFIRDTAAANGWLQDDVAVLRLSEAVTDIEPIAIAESAAQDDDLVPAGTLTRIIGWGALTFDTPGPEELNHAVLRRNTIAACNTLDLYSGDLTDINLCAGDIEQPGKSACYGDSGGPLIARAGKGKAVQVGVVSGGPGVCGEVPGYFARVGSLAEWIKQQVAKP
jgi:secreted trypsin-like serine protease